jgi:hypothetical protein
MGPYGRRESRVIAYLSRAWLTRVWGWTHQVRVAYGEASALSLAPCTTHAMRASAAAATGAPGCWVVAWDAADGDVSAFVSLEFDVASCGGEASCVRCAASAVVAGACLPGVYTYVFRVADAAGNAASDFVRVAVEQVRSTRVSLGVS